ncbi:hypothetical protein QBC46DRAFT_449380 [Diplogelasinospora grovesii]|uniref:Arb2 domain-containing protein n=1 Tax=Diplogelasinospora grovesii TaxID=303347 RepID=A0AAN6NB56_9PEZI|nr:hypothetical protein QBC46DRAFT_449380 [Diplogelasinospora grovesii]
MFRRKWTALPKDPYFGSELEDFGYFVHNKNAIRSIQDPRRGFRHPGYKNERWNDRQCFGFNMLTVLVTSTGALRKIVHQQLENEEGLQRVLLPWGVTNPAEPHVPIFTSPDLEGKSRIVVIFGETTQDLGILSRYVIANDKEPGNGLDTGSMIGIVRELKKQRSSAVDPKAPGIVLANSGELFWWPEGQRGLTASARIGMPLASAAHHGRRLDRDRHVIPGNLDVADHISYVMEQVVVKLAIPEAKIDVIAIGDAAEEFEVYINNHDAWKLVGCRLNTLTILGGFYSMAKIKNPSLSNFMIDRARAYTLSDEEAGTPIAPPMGNKKIGFTGYGCWAMSGGHDYYVDRLLITAHPAILKWIQEVAITETYKNPVFDIPDDADDGSTDVLDWDTENFADDEGADDLDDSISSPQVTRAVTKDAPMDDALEKLRGLRFEGRDGVIETLETGNTAVRDDSDKDTRGNAVMTTVEDVVPDVSLSGEQNLPMEGGDNSAWRWCV